MLRVYPVKYRFESIALWSGSLNLNQLGSGACLPHSCCHYPPPCRLLDKCPCVRKFTSLPEHCQLDLWCSMNQHWGINCPYSHPLFLKQTVHQTCVPKLAWKVAAMWSVLSFREIPDWRHVIYWISRELFCVKTSTLASLSFLMDNPLELTGRFWWIFGCSSF